MPTFYFPMKPSDIYTRRGRGDNNPPSLSRYSRTSFMQLPESPSPHKRRQSRFEIFPQQNNNRRGSSINFDFYQSMNSSNGDYNSTNYSNFSGAESSQNVDSKSKKIPQQIVYRMKEDQLKFCFLSRRSFTDVIESNKNTFLKEMLVVQSGLLKDDGSVSIHKSRIRKDL